MFRLNSLQTLFLATTLVSGGALAPAAFAAPAGNFGAGLILGEPTGLSAKYWMNNQQALDFALAYAFDEYFAFIVDFKHHFTGVGRRLIAGQEINPYVGVGLVMGVITKDASDDKIAAGVRVPLGLEWLFARNKLGLFVEIAPGMGIAPATEFLIQGGIGIRYYF